MLIRERRRQVHNQIYLARILSAGFQLPEKLFSLWTTLYSMEVSHANYTPGVVKDKELALQSMDTSKRKEIAERNNMMGRLEKLAVTESTGRTVTEAEREEAKRRLRRKHLKPAKG
jgi:hypothetical protein